MKVVDKVYGGQTIADPLIVRLINTKEMQRLKGIDQYGTYQFVNPKHTTTRFEHSLGVYLLLRKFKASREEQIAGLIHDVAHTAFSHAFDYLYEKPHAQNIKHDFHDRIHDRIVKNSKIAALLKKEKVDIDFILDDSNFALLERPLPELCADRLDYLFRDSLLFGKASKEEISKGLGALVVFDGGFVFKDEDSARLMAELYLKLSKEAWTEPYRIASNQILADAVEIAREKGMVSEKDFFLDDKSLLDKLKKTKNQTILFKLTLLDEKSFSEGTKNDYDVYVRGKVRYIDPEFLNGTKLERLSNIDESFKKDIEAYRKWAEEGFYIKITKKE